MLAAWLLVVTGFYTGVCGLDAPVEDRFQAHMKYEQVCRAAEESIVRTLAVRGAVNIEASCSKIS